MRKLWFAYLAKALVVFPGGFGTLDEMFEILTLAQTHKLAKKITVVIYGSEYWKKVFNLEALVDTGAISPKDIELFRYADTPEQAFEMLRAGADRELPGSRRPMARPHSRHRSRSCWRADRRGFPAAGFGQDQQVSGCNCANVPAAAVCRLPAGDKRKSSPNYLSGSISLLNRRSPPLTPN